MIGAYLGMIRVMLVGRRGVLFGSHDYVQLPFVDCSRQVVHVYLSMSGISSWIIRPVPSLAGRPMLMVLFCLKFSISSASASRTASRMLAMLEHRLLQWRGKPFVKHFILLHGMHVLHPVAVQSLQCRNPLYAHKWRHSLRWRFLSSFWHCWLQ